MRGAEGTRERAGPGLGSSRFGAAPTSCPWGCVLGPGGWSGAPFCPVHRPPGPAEPERGRWQAAAVPLNRSAVGDASEAWRAFHRGLEFWNHPDEPEESSEEEEEGEDQEWVDFSKPWVFSAEDDDPPYGYRDLESLLLPPELLVPTRLPRGLLEARVGGLPMPQGHRLTSEEAERNARELVAEEERMKRKAEKKKLKKKKQKDRKKREKLGQEQESHEEAEPTSPAAGARHPQASVAEERGPRTEELEEELDLSCTFVSKARQKAGVKLPVPGKAKAGRTGSAEAGGRAPRKPPSAPLPAPQVPEPTDSSSVEQSLILAGYGNEMAQEGWYAVAVEIFTQALRLNPREHRLLGNRSYCLEKLGRCEEALQDAQESLRLQPGWPKGLFRRGKALQGLQRYAEAADAFEELLRRDAAHAEAATQLRACRAMLLQNSRHSPQGGVPTSPSPLEAWDPPCPSAPRAPRAGQRASGSYWDPDDSGFITIGSSRSQARSQGRPVATSPQTLPPTHPARDCYPLWVGNVTPRISEKVLQRAFGRFGEIRFMRLLPERRCAFINYTCKKAAEAAYVGMQDAELEGSYLVLQLKHPSHATPSPRQHPQLGGLQ